MSRLEFSIAARQDLNGIFDYIANDRPRAAVQMVDDIENRCRVLADHPLAAEAHPEFGPDVLFFHRAQLCHCLPPRH